MPREGGAPSNPWPLIDPLRCLKRIAVVTGSPAFAGEDNSWGGARDQITPGTQRLTFARYAS